MKEGTKHEIRIGIQNEKSTFVEFSKNLSLVIRTRGGLWFGRQMPRINNESNQHTHTQNTVCHYYFITLKKLKHCC